jgi:outer membrane autotransporter protein
MAINFKKILLAGTARVAASAFSVQALAATQTDNTDNGSTAALTVSNAGVFTAPAAGVDEIFNVVDGVAVGEGGAIILSTNADGVGKLQFDGASVATGTIGGASNRLGLLTAGVNSKTVAISGNVFASTITLTGADAAATGTTTFGAGVTAGTFTVLANAGGTAAHIQTSTVTGDFTSTTLALTASGDAGSRALLTLNGATNALGTATLTDNTGQANLTFGGSTAQVVSGIINGSANGKGGLVIDNALGVTFSGTVGTTAGANNLRLVTIEKAGGDSAATFQNTLSATAIVLGGAGTGTNTLTLDGTTNAFTVTGTVNAPVGAETNNVVVSGGKTITTAGVWGGTGVLDSVAVSGTGTVLSAGASMSSTAFTVGTGATLQTSAGVTLTGTINGAGTLDINANTTVDGIIGGTTALTTVDVAAGTTLTMGTGATYAATTTNLSGVGTGIVSVSAAAHALTTNVTTATDGAGAFNVLDHASTSSITGNIGTSTHKLATMNIAGGAANVFTTTGNLYVNAITADAADTLQLIGTSAQTVSGTMTGGILIVGNTSAVATNATFNSALATIASAEVKAGATANFAAGLGAVTLTNAGTTTFSGTTASTLTGAITNTGTIYNTGTGTITTTALTNSGSGIVSLTGGSLTAGAGALTNQTGGTVTISSGKTLTAATHVAGTGPYNFGVSTTAATGLTPVAGKIVLTGGATNLTNATINVNVPSTSGFIATGTQFLIVDGTVAATTPAGAVSTATAVAADDSQLLSFTYARGDNAAIAGSDTDVYLIATRAAYSSIATTTGNDQAVGAALDAIAATGGTELDAIHGQLAAATTGAAVHRILESVTPTVDGSAQVGAMNVSAQVQGIADTRVASIRSGDAMSGVAAGASANGWNMWLQGYGQAATQDRKNGVAGYDADTIGGAIGIDTSSLITNGVLGFSFNYGKTSADSKNANTTDTDVDNYGLNVYGSLDVGHNYFVNGQVGYAHNNIDMARHNATGPGLGVTARGDTDSKQWSAKLAVGRDFAANHGMTMTPSASLSYARLSTDGYTETGAGAANLVVGSDTLSVAKLGVGATATWNMKNTDGSTMKPALRAGYAYQLTNDRAEATSHFSALPANTFKTQAAQADRSEFNVGGGLTYMTTANWDLSANYDYTYKANYDAHAGVIRATSHF